MWKFHLILAVILLLGIAGANASTMTDTVDLVEKNYRQEMGFDGQCYLDGQEVTLAELLYGLGIAEGGFNNGSAGLRTNNPGSLRRGLGIKKVVRTHSIDNSKTRPEYETMYDGLYEKAYLVANRYGCSFGYKGAFAYTSGPNADPKSFVAGTKITKRQNAYNWLGNAKNGVKKYHKMKGTTEPIGTPPTETVAYSEPIQSGCRWVGTAKEGERIQIDQHGIAGFLKILREYIVGKDEKTMVFICDK